MSNQEYIEKQRELLAVYRRTLQHCLMQHAHHGTAYVPPSVIAGIMDARENIRRIKMILQSCGSLIEDHPDDDDEVPNHHTAKLDILSEACRLQVKQKLETIGPKYDPELYTPRDIEHDINAFCESESVNHNRYVYLVVAPAGSGKTNLLCGIARSHSEKRHVIFLIGGSLYLEESTGLVGTIQHELQFSRSGMSFDTPEACWHMLKDLSEQSGKSILILIDAINEYEKPNNMRKALKNLISKTKDDNFRVIITCRDYYWEYFKADFWEYSVFKAIPDAPSEKALKSKDTDFYLFSAREYDYALPLYFRHYNVNGQLSDIALAQCRHPLLLKFFCEAYRNRDISDIKDIRLKELFDKYWERKIHSIAEAQINQGEIQILSRLENEAEKYLLSIAAYMLESRQRFVPQDSLSWITKRSENPGDPRSLYGRIRDEFIILEEKFQEIGASSIPQIAFVYEEFMEYTMALSLLQSWKRSNLDVESILIEIGRLTRKYTSFAQIMGVVVYLALMLKSDYKISLWSLLLKEGERWREAAFEAIRKLPENQIDSSTFEALAAMLQMKDEHALVQTLDLLKLERIGRETPLSFKSTLSSLTKHPHEGVRRRVALALGNMSAELAMPLLTEMLTDHRQSVVRNAAASLDQSLDPLKLERFGRGAPLLFKSTLSSFTKHPYESVRRRVALALGNMSAELAVPLLTAMLTDHSQSVVQNAVASLAQLNDILTLEALLVALKNWDWKVSVTASAALGRLKDMRAVDPLRNTLELGHEELRRTSIISLSQIWELSLLSELVSNDKSVRQDAAARLGSLGDKRAVDPLLATLKDSDLDVRAAAITALGQIGDPKVIQALSNALRSAYSDERKLAIDALSQIRAPKVSTILATATADIDQSVRAAAIRTLSKIGDRQACEALIAVTQDSDDEIRKLAFEGLLVLNFFQTIDQQASEQMYGKVLAMLHKSTSDSNRQVRLAAITALYQLGDPQGFDTLVEMAQDTDNEVRTAAVVALGSIKDLRAVDKILILLEDRVESVRHAAVTALGNIGDLRAVDSLLYMPPRSTKTKKLIQAALDSIAEKAVVYLFYKHTSNEYRIQLAVRIASSEFNDNILSQLLWIFGSLSTQIDPREVWAINWIGESKFIELLIQVLTPSQYTIAKNIDTSERIKQAAIFCIKVDLRNPLESIRISALKALQQIEHPISIKFLEEARIESKKRIESAITNRFTSIDSKQILLDIYIVIGERKDISLKEWEDALVKIIDMTRIGDAKMRSLAISFIKTILENNPDKSHQIMEDNLMQIIDIMKTGDAKTRAHAVFLLGKTGHTRTVEFLSNALKDRHPSVRLAAVVSLGQLGNVIVVDQLISILNNRKEFGQIRVAVIRAFRLLETSQSFKSLLNALRDPNVEIKIEAATALGELGNPMATSALRSILKDTNKQVRLAAKSALRQIGEQ